MSLLVKIKEDIMISTAIYVRLSDEDRDKNLKTDESESIQNQKSMLVDYCKERNWDIYDIYCDEDYSGADRKRPDFNRMLNDCEQGKINIVLCKSQSRFSRDMEIIEKYLHDKFLEWNVRFISIVDHADTSDLANKKSRQINGLINEWYLEDTSESIRRTLQHKREKGEFIGSFAPYGYLVDPNNKNKLIVDTEAAPIVRSIFEWYVQGWGYRKIVIELNNMKVPSPTLHKQKLNSKYVNKNESKSPAKGLWTQSTIYTILRNETYTGTLVQGKSHTISYKNKKKKRVPPENWVKIPNSHKPIIDIDLWTKAQERLASRTRVKKTAYELSPLAGKVKCAVCGKPMKRNVYYNKDKTIQYYNLQCASYKIGAMNCTNTVSISGRELERIILEQLNQLVSQYCQMDKIDIKTRQDELVKEKTLRLNSIKEQFAAAENKLEKLYEDKLDGIISKDQYLSYSKKITKEIDDLKALSKNLEEQITAFQKEQSEYIDKEEIIKKYSQVNKLTREVVDEFIDTIYIGEKVNSQREIRILWKI